jgi:hypothetical protein
MGSFQIKHRITMQYNRLHFRAIDVTQTSPLNQEKVTIKFHQSLVHTKALAIGLAIATDSNCI